jgi:hypothetical protein
MGVECHSFNFNELEEPYVGRSYHVQIEGGHYIISICQELSCICPNCNFAEPIRWGYKFSLANISIGFTTLGLVVKAKVLYIRPHCPPRK